MSKGQKIAISLGAILFVICLVIDIWYGYILLFGKEKVVSKTFNVSTLTLADGTTTNIFEVEYFANKDNSGYEAFEIKLTNYMDESRESTFIQGLQYIANSTTSSIDIQLAHNDVWVSDKPYKVKGHLWWEDKYYYCYNSYVPTANTDVFNYMSADDEMYLRSTNPINMETRYKIQIGEDIYLMQFKGIALKDEDLPNPLELGKLQKPYTPTEIGTVRTKHKLTADDIYHTQYYTYDINLFVKSIYDAVKTATLGTNDDITFEWGNWFNYYKFNPDENAYEENPTDYTNVKIVSGDIKSYYSIRVKTHEYGLSNAKDSLFGSVLGNRNFSLNNDYSAGDYFIGRTVVDCDISSFDFVTVDENNVALKLNNSFTNYYILYKDSIVLSVVIDLDLLESLGYTFVGFTADNGLDKFNIYECYTTSQGEIVEDYTSELKVVEYD